MIIASIILLGVLANYLLTAPDTEEPIILKTSKFVYTPLPLVTREMAYQARVRAEADLNTLEQFSLSTRFIHDTLLQTKRYYIGNEISVLEEEIATYFLYIGKLDNI